MNTDSKENNSHASLGVVTHSITWIPLADKKPSNYAWSKDKLVTDGERIWVDCYYASTDDPGSGNGFWLKHRDGGRITHWADLPAFP